MNEKTNKLILDYMPLAEKMAWEKCRSTPPNISIDDLKSAAYFGLVDAANKYDYSVNFCTYARIRIMGEIFDFMRGISWGTRKSPFIPLSLDNDCVFDCFVSDCKCDFLEEISHKIKSSLYLVLRKYYIDGYSLKDIGNQLGVSESRISQMLSQAKKSAKIELSRDAKEMAA
jgi:RNA polymerase sigma factor for flagellar operon FliA